MQMLDMLAKDGYVALKWKAEADVDGVIECHVKNLLYDKTSSSLSEYSRVFSKAFKTTKTLSQREYLQHSETQCSINPQLNKLHGNLTQFTAIFELEVNVTALTLFSSGNIIYWQQKFGISRHSIIKQSTN